MFQVTNYSGFIGIAAGTGTGTGTGSEVAGLQSWWDFSDEARLVTTSGAWITTASDKTGGTKNLIGQNAHPVYVKNAIGTMGVANFKPSTSVRPTMIGSGAITGTASTEMTVVWVGKINQTSVTGAVDPNALMCEIRNAESPAVMMRPLSGGGGSGSTRSLIGLGLNNGNQLPQSITGILADTPHIYAAALGTTTQTMRLDGGTMSAGGTYTNTHSTWQVATAIYVGNGTGSTPSTPAGMIGEMRIFDSFLSEEDIEKEEGYLAWKWGLEDILPADHPYKTASPYPSTYGTGTNTSVTTLTDTGTPAAPTVNDGIELAAWYDFSNSSSLVLSGGTQITTASDLSGNDFHMTATATGTSSGGPNVGTFGTLAAADFLAGGEGAGRYLSIVDDIFANGTFGAITVSMIAMSTDTTSNIATLLAMFPDDSASPDPDDGEALFHFYGSTQGTGTDNKAVLGNYVFEDVFRAQRGYTIPDTGHFYVLAMEDADQLSGGTAGGRYDGGDRVGTGTPGDSGYDAGYVVLGNYFGGDAYPWRGMIGEVRIFAGKLDRASMQAEEAYLAWKWGRNDLLPVGHPFKYQPPWWPLATNTAPNTTGMSAWYDFSDDATLTLDGLNITDIADKGTNSFDLTSDDGLADEPWPVLQACGIKGRQVASFCNAVSASGDDCFKYIGGEYEFSTHGTAGSVVCVARMDEPRSSPGRLFSLIDNVDDQTDMFTVGHSYTGQTSETCLVLGGNNWTTNTFVFPDEGAVYSAGFEYDDETEGTSTMRISGGVSTRSAAFSYSALPIGWLSIGNTYPGADGGASWGGAIGEIRIFDRLLSEAEFQTEEGYLAWKWGLQDMLPASHPYKTAAP